MNFPAPPTPEWATVVPSRRGKAFKMHGNKGQASSALSYHFPDDDVQLLHWDGTEWQVEFEYTRRDTCDRCGHNHFGYERRVSERGKGPQWQREVICRACELEETVDRYLGGGYYGIPYVYRDGDVIFARAKTIPGFIDKWNLLVEKNAEQKAEQARQARIKKG